MFSLAQQSSGSGDVLGIFILLLQIAIVVAVIAGLWKVFTKAGEPGWAAIIPIYNTYILIKIVGRPWWWLLLMLIPCVSIVIAIIVMLDLAKSFGKSVAFAIGLILLTPIFIIILGFSDAKYLGPSVRR
jgi:hypothetical protein